MREAKKFVSVCVCDCANAEAVRDVDFVCNRPPTRARTHTDGGADSGNETVDIQRSRHQVRTHCYARVFICFRFYYLLFVYNFCLCKKKSSHHVDS